MASTAASSTAQDLAPTNTGHPRRWAILAVLVVSLLVVMRYPVSVWARVATLAQLAIVWFAIVYAGEHYAIDVVAGTAFGAVAFVLVERFHGRLTAAALGRDAEPAPVTDEVVVVRQVLAPEQVPSAVGQAPGDGTTRG